MSDKVRRDRKKHLSKLSTAQLREIVENPVIVPLDAQIASIAQELLNERSA